MRHHSGATLRRSPALAKTPTNRLIPSKASLDNLGSLFYKSGTVIRIRLNFSSRKPVYWQIVDQIKYLAASGALREGDPLPSIRPLAEELRVNRNTVIKAYDELEHEGVIETVAGKGCFVKGNHSPLRAEVRESVLTEAIDAAIVQAHQFRISREEFLKKVRERLDHFDSDNHTEEG